MVLHSSFGFMLAKAAQRLAGICEAELSSLGLTTRQAGLLMAIRENDPASQKNIGKLLRIDRTTMVALLDDLEANGYVKRVKDLNDRRAYNLILLKKGNDVLDHAWQIIQTAEGIGLKDLSEKERQLLAKLLSRIVK
jgi:DNA-binding MarR family transcriptional regulator